MTNNNNKHFEMLKSAFNFIRFINEYAEHKSDILEVVDLISNLTADSDFDFDITYRGYGEKLDITVWVDDDILTPYVSIRGSSTYESEEFCEKFDLPNVEWTYGIQIAEKVANGEF